MVKVMKGKQTFGRTLESSKAVTEVGLESTINQMTKSSVTDDTASESWEVQWIAGEWGIEA